MKYLVIMLFLATTLFGKITIGGKEYSEKQVNELIKYHNGITPLVYVEDYHLFWYDTCETLKTVPSGKILLDVEKAYNIKSVCYLVLNYSRLKYTNKALKCYFNKVKLFKCLEQENVIDKLIIGG